MSVHFWTFPGQFESFLDHVGIMLFWVLGNFELELIQFYLFIYYSDCISVCSWLYIANMLLFWFLETFECSFSKCKTYLFRASYISFNFYNTRIYLPQAGFYFECLFFIGQFPNRANWCSKWKLTKRGLLVESKQKIMPFLVLLAITQAAIIIGKVLRTVRSAGGSHCRRFARSRHSGGCNLVRVR